MWQTRAFVQRNMEEYWKEKLVTFIKMNEKEGNIDNSAHNVLSGTTSQFLLDKSTPDKDRLEELLKILEQEKLTEISHESNH